MTLIDSSVWIAFWRNADSAVSQKAAKLIKGRKACITGIILTELLQGARTKEEMDYLKTILGDIPRLPLDDDTFIGAADIVFQLRRLGKTVHTTDAIIAAAAIRNGADVFSLDEHFRMIQSVAPLKLTAVS